MIYSDETQKKLRENNIILENEVALQQGDLVVAENVLTKERRLIDKNSVNSFINNSISESKSKVELLKG